MQNPRDLTARIDGLIRSEALPMSQDAAPLATAYALLSRQAHDRLARCQDLLARGLRSEAVQEAETEPALLVLASSLELQAFKRWQDFCRGNDLPTPYEVREDVVAELNRAYAAEQLVSPLLREYRMRCVVRAPLTARIAALRALAGVDRGNRAWAESLVELERERLREIPGQVQAAMGDVEVLQEVQRELIDDRRKVPAPQKLLEHVESALQDGRVQRAQQDLEALLPALSEAYSAMDFPACRALLENWTQTLKAVGRTALQVPEDLRAGVEPALRWVEEQATRQEAEAAFKGACARLTDAVAAHAGPEPLTRALAEAEVFELTLPESLAADARAELSRRRAVVRRRRRLKQSAVVLAVLGLSGLTAWGVQLERTRRDVDQRLVGIQASVDHGRLDSATSAWGRFVDARPSHVESPEAVSVREKLDRALDAEQKRSEAFAQNDQALAQTTAEHLTSESLAALAELSNTDAELARVEHHRQRFAEHQAQRARANDLAALKSASAWRDTLSAIGSDALDENPQAVHETAQEALAWLAEQRPRPGVSASTRRIIDASSQQAQSLAAGAQAVLDARERNRQRGDAEALLASYAHAPTRLAQLLHGYTEQFPESPLALPFARSASRSVSWEAVRDWYELRATWGSKTTPIDLKQAALRLRDTQAYTEANPRSPMSDAVEAYRQYWGAAILASAEEGPWRGELPRLLRAPIFRDLGVADTVDGRRFYVVGDGNRRETSLGTTIDVVLTPDTTQPTTRNFPVGALGPVEPSPQSLLAADLLGLVTTYDVQRWHTFPVDVIEAVLGADDVDPVLRGVVAELLLNNLETATGRLHPELAALRDRLAVHGDQAVNWLNPEDLPSQTTRRFLTALLEEPRDTQAWREALDAERSAIHRAVSPPAAGHAVLMPDDRGQLALQGLPDSRAERLEIWAVVPNPDETDKSLFERVGYLNDQRVTLDGWSPDALPFGSPVWLITPDDTGADGDVSRVAAIPGADPSERPD